MTKNLTDWSVSEVEITGGPGPEYVDITKITIPGGYPFGWYLRIDQSSRLWIDRYWDPYVRNFISAGLPSLFMILQNLNPDKVPTDKELEWHIVRIAGDIHDWSMTYYQQILKDLGFPEGKKPTFEGSKIDWNDPSKSSNLWRQLAKVGNDLGHYAYRSYYGGTLDEAWLAEHLPVLSAKINTLSLLLPARRIEKENPVRASNEGSVQFGDGVVGNYGDYYVVTMPRNGSVINGLRANKEFYLDSHFQNCMFDVAQVVRSFAALPDATQEAIEPYRKGVVIAGAHYDKGVYFLDKNSLVYLKTGDWDKIPVNPRSCIKKVFSSRQATIGKFWIAVHTGGFFWRIYVTASQPEMLDQLNRIFSDFPIQKEIERGVYEGRPDRMSKIEIYHGVDLIQEHHLLRGQGEDMDSRSAR